MTTTCRVTVWGENRHEQINATVRAIYPDGMHNAIAAGLREQLGPEALVRIAILEQPEHGLSDAILETTDVLTWWGIWHMTRLTMCWSPRSSSAYWAAWG